MKVIVIGAGIGGLALAQRLRAAGVEVSMHERDPDIDRPWDGYRLHINPAGSRALRACLPAASWAEFLATAGPGGDFGFLTEQLDELVVVEESIMYPVGGWPEPDHYAADRATLRRILAAGLPDVIRFDAEFVGYQRQADGRVAARFADGHREVGDLLVGADGAASAVRQQLLPGADPRDVGIVGVAHKIWLTDEARAALPPRLTTGMNLITVDAPCFLFTSVFAPPRPPARPYLLCALVARAELLPPDLVELDPDALRVAVDVLVAGWHPALRRALAESDRDSRRALRFRATDPIPAWEPGPVTLLGDAVHTMPPVGGLGGNTALRDADLLGRQLAAVHRGERTLTAAVGGYQVDMRDYGSAAVRYALTQAEQALAAGAVATAGARAFFRLCRAVPALRRRTFARGWSDPAAPRPWEHTAA